MRLPPHVVDVWRTSSTVDPTTKAETFGPYTKVYSRMPCEAEPMAAYRQATVLGKVGGGVFCLTWATQSLQEGDRIKWNGKVYTLALNSDDRYRESTSPVGAYQTGTIEEDALTKLP